MYTMKPSSFAKTLSIHLLLMICCSLLSAGCCLVTIDTMKNKELDLQHPPSRTKASQTVSDTDLSNDVFIGLSLSGGGSRAANFSTAVMLELKRLGILDKVTAISSVSGGSLPAAYYGVNPAAWDPANPGPVRKLMRNNFESDWFRAWFYPNNFMRYWFTNFTRSDIMKNVLDDVLFKEKTFGDMGAGQPRILINATTMSKGRRFVFSAEEFRKFNSRIDNFPVANAVMASSAFPGVFHDMTIKDYSLGGGNNYEHLLDGGPSDNLGTSTLLDLLDQLYSRDKKPRGCFLFVVDSYPYPLHPKHVHEADSRRWIDYIFDTNIADSSDAMLTARRFDLLNWLNIDVDKPVLEVYQENTDKWAIYTSTDPDDFTQAECIVWHLSFQRLLSPDFASTAVKNDPALRQDITDLAIIVNDIPTRYKLTGTRRNDKEEIDLDSEAVQNYIFKAARYLINKDNTPDGKPTLDRACAWFNERGLKVCDKR